MSRPTTRQRTGAIFAVVAFVLGVTAAAAVGWGGQEQGKEKHHGGKAPPTVTYPKEHQKEYPPKVPPTAKTPPPVTPVTPATPATPPAVVTTPPPTPTTPAPPVTTETGPPSTTPETPPTTTTEKTPPTETTPTPPKAPPLAPVAERKELASTGLNPGLIAFAGALCLLGGGFLFRRALARN